MTTDCPLSTPSASPGRLRRAMSDYLAVSRAAGLYASVVDYELAEQAAWRTLEEALLIEVAERSAQASVQPAPAR